MKKLFRNLSSTRIALIGFVLMFLGQAISWKILKVEVGDLIANTGALILVVGLLQWLFDEESRESLVSYIAASVTKRISERDRCGIAGIRDCLTDAKSMCSPPIAEELEKAKTLAIGFQYSDGLMDRYRQIISRRIAAQLSTEIAHVRGDGKAAAYLAVWMDRRIDVRQKVADMVELIRRHFGDSPLIRITTHDVVIRYSFVYTESFLWLTFMTNSHLRQPLMPALKVESGTPLYEVFKSDIEALGISV